MMKSLLGDRSHDEVAHGRQVRNKGSRFWETGRMMKSLLGERSHDEVASGGQVA